jgi:hypothetical protein
LVVVMEVVVVVVAAVEDEYLSDLGVVEVKI